MFIVADLVSLTAHINTYLHTCICQYKPKGEQICGFGGQFTCSRLGADPEMIVSGWGGRSSLTDILVVIYLAYF